MATVAIQPCPSWTRGSIPISKPIQRRRFRGRTKLTRLKVLAAVVEATPSTTVPSIGNGNNRVLTLPFNRADDLQAEARAMGRAVNATLYSPELLASKYGSQPIKVFCFY